MAIPCLAFCLRELIEDFSWLHTDLAAEQGLDHMINAAKFLSDL